MVDAFRLRHHHRYLLSERDERFDHYGIIGTSRAIQDVVGTARLVAQSRSTVLITGETGTGKELVARAIHDWSAQREAPLVKVNCAAIPETLLESELFGYERGAFTGAMTNKPGLLETAHGGRPQDRVKAFAMMKTLFSHPPSFATSARGKIASIEATSETEVVFTLCSTDPAFLAKLAFIFVMASFLSRPEDELRLRGNFWKCIAELSGKMV